MAFANLMTGMWQGRAGHSNVSFDLRTVVTGVLVSIGYYLGAKLGLALTFEPHPISVLWPPNSILVAGLLLTPPRIWWFLLLAAFPAHWGPNGMVFYDKKQFPPRYRNGVFIAFHGSWDRAPYR